MGRQGNIAKVNVGVTYHLGLLLSVLIMVALPLIYVALIALACYGVYLC